MADTNGKRGIIKRTAQDREMPVRDLLQELYFIAQSREGVAAILDVDAQSVERALFGTGLQEAVLLVPLRSDEYHIGYDKEKRAEIWDNPRWQHDAYDRLAARIIEYLAGQSTPRLDEAIARFKAK